MTMDQITYSTPLSRSTMAYVLAGGRGSRLMELTENRAKPAVYFGGKSRIIDFALSNALNSGHPPHRGRDAIQGAQPDPPPAARLELPAADAQRELRHPAREPARGREPVVRRAPRTPCSRTSTSSTATRPSTSSSLAGDHVYKMDYERMLVQHVNDGADVTSAASRCRRREAASFGVMHVDAADRIMSFVEKPDAAARDAGSAGLGAREHGHLRVPARVPERAVAARCRRSAFVPRLRARHHSVPGAARQGRRAPLRRARACAREAEHADVLARRGNARRVLRGEYRPDRRRCRRSTSSTSDWPIWTYAEITPPAKFVHDADGRRGVGHFVARLRRLHRVRLDASPLAAVHRRARAFVRHDRERRGPALCRDRPSRAAAQRHRRSRRAASPPSSSSARIPNSTRAGSDARRRASASSRRR